MDEQLQLLTSIRDILTRIERVLERIEVSGNAPKPAEDAAVAVAPPAELPPEPPVAKPVAVAEKPSSATPAAGKTKWRKRY